MTRPIPPQHRKVRKNYASNWKNHRADGTFKKSRAGKYNARGDWLDGHFFHSRAELMRYAQLREMEKGGRIFDLELQPPFQCLVNNKLVCTYVADFRYKKRGTGMAFRILVEDVKGMVTREYAIKRKLMAALHPATTIHEIPADGIDACRFLTADEIGA